VCMTCVLPIQFSPSSCLQHLLYFFTDWWTQYL